MGSYCGIHFDELSICDSKSAVPDDWAALFQERDRHEQTKNHTDEQDDEPQRIVEYVVSRDVFLRRLAILGATEESIRRVFDEWLCQERETWQSYSEDWAEDGEIGVRAGQILKGLNELDYVKWCHFASESLRTRYDFANWEKRELDLDPFKKQFYELQESYIWFAGYGSHINLRALTPANTTTSLQP